MRIFNRSLVFSLLTFTLLNGCSKEQVPNQSFVELDDILQPTETTPKERTDHWYADQDSIRTNVLRACYLHAKEQVDTSDDPKVLATFQQNVFLLYTPFPDCIKARSGELIKVGEMRNQGVLVTRDQQEQLSFELSQTQTQEHIDESAALLASKLKEDKKLDDQNATNAKTQMNEYTKQGGKIDGFMQLSDADVADLDKKFTSNSSEKSQ